MKTLNVKSSAYPNGDYRTYKHGMQKPKILPSNHPTVLLMRYQRATNEDKTSMRLLNSAKQILKKAK